MSEYPEHDKIRALGNDNQTAGEFLDWLLNDKGYSLCTLIPEGDNRYDDPEHWQPTDNHSTEKLLYEFFGIDADKIEDEKLHMLEQLREQA